MSDQNKIELSSKMLSYIQEAVPVSAKQIESVLDLSENQQCTVPFITRYRKEKTGGLDEVAIRGILERFEGFNELVKRRQYIIEQLKKLEKLTPQLEKAIEQAETILQLEDIYAPFKSKRKTKAQKAQELGLQVLADYILTTKEDRSQLAHKFQEWYQDGSIKPEVKDLEEALNGAYDILIDSFAHEPDIKSYLRDYVWKNGVLQSTKRDKADEIEDSQKFQDYFEFSGSLKDLMKQGNAHRFLAIRRGMTLKVLKVELLYEEEPTIIQIKSKFFPNAKERTFYKELEKCAQKSFRQYLRTSLDLEIKTELKQNADEGAINVFAINLRNLLLAPYLGAKTVMGIDPGIRTGCKVAIVDQSGKFIKDDVIYLGRSSSKDQEEKAKIEAYIAHYKVEYVAIGNGTYGRETYQFLTQSLDNSVQKKIKISLISEAGASVYSASDIAREEFPELDSTVRGAISLARRFQDPLAELVKIDPKSIGVGQYQHDVSQTKLKKSLGGVVESCVNYVGVDLNTASYSLLNYVSGLTDSLAKRIVERRQQKGAFQNRSELLKVAGLNQKRFQQAAGFLRIHKGNEPLDATFIHPEQYKFLQKWCSDQGITTQELLADKKWWPKLETDHELSQCIGSETFKDIINGLKAPSQDPRTVFKAIEFKDDVRSIQDLKLEEWYQGEVTNITRFGAFVNIGIKENGLLHISQIADHFVEDPLSILKVGQELRVRVIQIDKDRGRISLSCRKKEQGMSHSGSTKGKNKKRNEHDEKMVNNPFAKLKLKVKS